MRFNEMRLNYFEMANIIYLVALITFIGSCLGQPVFRSDRHNYMNCPHPNAAKSLLLDEPLQIPGRLLKVQKRTLLFPDATINTKRITCIMITNMSTNGNDGYVEVVDGGIGNYDVTIHFTTQLGKGMSFRIRIYGE